MDFDFNIVKNQDRGQWPFLKLIIFIESAGADAIKKFTPSLGIPYLGV